MKLQPWSPVELLLMHDLSPGSGTVELSLPAEGEGTHVNGHSGQWLRCEKNHHKPHSHLFGFLSQLGGWWASGYCNICPCLYALSGLLAQNRDSFSNLHFWFVFFSFHLITCKFILVIQLIHSKCLCSCSAALSRKPGTRNMQDNCMYKEK